MKFLDQVKIYVKAGNGAPRALEERNSLNTVDQTEVMEAVVVQ